MPISVTEPVSLAMKKTKEILFAPFNAGKWFTLGFCAWLAYLGSGGGSGFNSNFNSGLRTRGGGGGFGRGGGLSRGGRNPFDDIESWVHSN